MWNLWTLRWWLICPSWNIVSKSRAMSTLRSQVIFYNVPGGPTSFGIWKFHKRMKVEFWNCQNIWIFASKLLMIWIFTSNYLIFKYLNFGAKINKLLNFSVKISVKYFEFLLSKKKKRIVKLKSVLHWLADWLECKLFTNCFRL